LEQTLGTSVGSGDLVKFSLFLFSSTDDSSIDVSTKDVSSEAFSLDEPFVSVRLI
jgi:hypothetical protein